MMGEILKEMGWARDTYMVSSKVYWGGDLPNQKGLSRKHIVEGCNASLKRMQVDYFDLYFCHRPDLHTPMEETVWSMHHLIEQGIRVKWIAATALVQLLQQARQELDLMGVMTKLDKYRVMIIDDIGYVKKTNSETQYCSNLSPTDTKVAV